MDEIQIGGVPVCFSFMIRCIEWNVAAAQDVDICDTTVIVHHNITRYAVAAGFLSQFTVII